MNFEKLDEFLAHQEERGIPACDMTVTVDGRVVYRSLWGFSDLEKTKPTSTKDMYYLYSLSKVATCVGALRALERGLIALDDPVSKYLPAFAHLKVRQRDGSVTDAQNVMTVKHLFTMSGGLNYDTHTPALERARAEGRTDTVSFVSAIAETPLFFEPGTSYEYSMCHDVLAAVVEVASGIRFADYQKREIFDPLGMTDTTYHMNEEQRSRLSTLYGYDEATYEAHLRYSQNNDFIFSPAYDSGGAGLSSTADSYLPLIATVSRGGTALNGYELLRPETVQMMQKNYLSPEATRKFAAGRFGGYGWGLCCRTHLRPDISFSPSSVGECGWDSAGNAYALMDPAKKIGILYVTHVCGCNTGYFLFHPKLRALTYEALES